jgi:hypothetical protein
VDVELGATRNCRRMRFPHLFGRTIVWAIRADEEPSQRIAAIRRDQRDHLVTNGCQLERPTGRSVESFAIAPLSLRIPISYAVSVVNEGM